MPGSEGRYGAPESPTDSPGGEEIRFSEFLAAITDSQGHLPTASTADLSQEEQVFEQEREVRMLLESLMERQKLFEKLARIQGSISLRRPLQDVLDNITEGARELMGDEVVGLRLIDLDDPGYVKLVSHCGVPDHLVASLERSAVGEGAGGRAMAEDKLVIIDDYSNSEDGLPAFVANNLRAAMAAPVRESGKPIGSLVVATFKPGRRFTNGEKGALLALAEHAGLAITDARTVQAMREAQRARDMFLAMVSHELKTPLTVIMGTIRTLERHHGALSETARAEMLDAAFERCRDLERLIDRLLQGASAELADAVQNVWMPDLISGALRGFDHAFRLHVETIPDIHFETSPASVQRVIGILVENALAHSSRVSLVSVGVTIDGPDARIHVRNEGSLPDGDAEQLFEPFQRGPDATSSGVGLGLYIARRIARTMGAELCAFDDGSTVCFELKLPLQHGSVRRKLGG
jgi:signal transduction histidine kinase